MVKMKVKLTVSQLMHVVRGQPRHGLIVDPGAASALMGTETLNSHHVTLAPKPEWL